MNKREILEEIIRQKGGCFGISCGDCPLNASCGWNKRNLAEAKKLLSEIEDDEVKIPILSVEEVIEKALREWQPANRTFLPATIAQALRAAGKLREGE